MSHSTYTDPSGRVWRPYVVEFTSQDSAVGHSEATFSFVVYAISDLHAQLQVEAVRETAVIKGELVSLA